MRAVFYGRKSTDEHQIESLDTQCDSGHRFIGLRGWSHEGDYLDTASGGEWAPHRRPEIHRLLADARAGLFEIVVVRDDSRLGRDMLRTPLFVQDLLDAGVRVFFYSTGEEFRIDDMTARLMATIRAYGSEKERTEISSRTREALARKAQAGLVAGGLVFGYRNREVLGPDGKRVHVVREVLPDQAVAVVEIFERYANGDGLRSLAKDLSARKVPGPRGHTWSPSGIHAILRRELYRGVVLWGAATKVYRGGTKTRTDRHERSRVTRIAPELRIVSEELWTRVATKIAGQHRGGAQRGAGAPARHLLSGILRCGTCGGPMMITPGKRSYGTIRVYTCAHRRSLGTCKSSLRREKEIVETALIEWVAREVLTERIIDRALDILRERAGRDAKEKAVDRGRIQADVDRLREAVGKLADAAAEAPTGAREAMWSRIAERQRELVAAEDRLRVAVVVPPAMDAEIGRLGADARSRLVDLRGALLDAPAEARAFLQALFPSGVRADRVETPQGAMMRLVGEAHPGRAFGFGVDAGSNSASPAGFEPATRLKAA